MKVLLFVAVIALSCSYVGNNKVGKSNPNIELSIDDVLADSLKADHFDYPVGKPEASGYYNAQGFGKNNHLGDDWNAVTGGNTDLGHPVYAIANGYVNSAEDYRGGWGNVVRISHFLPDGTEVESLYAHFDTVMVEAGSWVSIGDQIGTIGDAHGVYTAHLHLELRSKVGMPLGGGYSRDTEGYLDPQKFIKSHR